MLCVFVRYLGSIVAEGDMWSSPRLHGKSHNFSFDKYEQQNKHLEESKVLTLEVLLNFIWAWAAK